MEKQNYLDGIIQFAGEVTQEVRQRRQDDLDAMLDQAFDNGMVEGLFLAAKAMLKGKITEEKMTPLLCEQWDLPPSKVTPFITAAKKELKQEESRKNPKTRS